MGKKLKGFTLVELLFVIAILGIILSIMLAYLANARKDGDNAKIKAQLSQIRAGAGLYYDNNNNSYVNLCSTTDPAVRNYLIAGNYPGGSPTTFYCFANATAYSVSMQFRVAEGTFTHWCVDHLGNSKGRAAAVTSASASGCNQ